MVIRFNLILFLYFIFCNISSFSQIDSVARNDTSLIIDSYNINDGLKFISLCTNNKFPLEAINKKIYEGFVYVKFQVNNCGRIFNIIPIKYSNELFIKYAKEYLDQILVDLNSVNNETYYTLKISFKVD